MQNDDDHDFRCIITAELMRDPVLLVETGFSYERRAIEAWLKHKNTCPRSNRVLANKSLTPNHQLRLSIGRKYPYIALEYELEQKKARELTAVQVGTASMVPSGNDTQITLHFQLAEWQQTEFKDIAAKPMTFCSQVEVKELTQYVAEQIGLPPFRIALFYRETEENDVIAFWSFDRRVQLSTFLELEPTMNLIFVIKPKSPNRNTEVRVASPRGIIRIYVNLDTTTIQEVKNIIAWKTCIPPTLQHLFVPKEGELQNGRVMSSYKPTNLCDLTLGVFPEMT